MVEITIEVSQKDIDDLAGGDEVKMAEVLSTLLLNEATRKGLNSQA